MSSRHHKGFPWKKESPCGLFEKKLEVGEMLLLIKATLGLILLAGIIIGWQVMVRQLANIGWFWVRVPEMTALAIMKDRALDRILVICPDNIWQEIQICCGEAGLQKILRLQKSLYFIGRPWVYRVYEWYFTESEEKDIKIRPLHSLTLAILNLIYEPQAIDESTGVLNLMTADGVEVKAKLTFYGAIRNPEKALFNIEYIKTYIRDLIIPKWRDVLSKFQFFEYQDLEEAKSSEAYLISRMDELSSDLREILGIPEDQEHKKFSQVVSELTGVARSLYEEAGIIFKDITLGEFEPVSPEVRSALEQILVAKTTAKKIIQEAVGKKEARILQGEGERGYLDKLGENKQYLLAIRAIETATENLGKVQSLTLLNLNNLLGPLLQQLKKSLN